MLPQTAGYRPLVPHGPFYPAFTSTIPEGRTFNMTEYNKFRLTHPFHDKKNENSPNLGTDTHICCQISLNNGWISPSLLVISGENGSRQATQLGAVRNAELRLRDQSPRTETFNGLVDEDLFRDHLVFLPKDCSFCSGFHRYIYIYNILYIYICIPWWKFLGVTGFTVGSCSFGCFVRQQSTSNGILPTSFSILRAYDQLIRLILGCVPFNSIAVTHH